MQAHIEHNLLLLTLAQQVEGQWVLETPCRDYDHYCTLPSVVSYNGIICGKTGWSSDRNYACYKSGATYARKIT